MADSLVHRRSQETGVRMGWTAVGSPAAQPAPHSQLRTERPCRMMASHQAGTAKPNRRTTIDGLVQCPTLTDAALQLSWRSRDSDRIDYRRDAPPNGTDAIRRPERFT